MTPPKKSDHKQAWQTAQRALHVARNTEATVQTALQRQQPRRWGKRVNWLLATALAGAGIIFALWPRLQIDMSDGFDPVSPFPASVTITNGFLPLDHVSIFIRPCSVLSSQGNSRIIGSSNCSRADTGGGGITRPEWREKHLAPDERWNVPLGRTVPLTFDTGEADMLLVITYWPWPFPTFGLPPFENSARFTVTTLATGNRGWIRRPLD